MPRARPTCRVIALVGAAHFVSHVYILVLPPLFPFVRAEFGVTYTGLGIAIAIFNILTGLLQTPAGFLVDRLSARAVLIGGLLLGAVSLAGAALVSSFTVFVVMFALLGVAKAAYHPADYALLSGRVSAAAHEPGLFDPYLRGLCRNRRGARDAPDPGRKSRAGAARSRGGGVWALPSRPSSCCSARSWPAAIRPASRRRRARRKRHRLAASWCRRRSCSVCASTCCWR